MNYRYDYPSLSEQLQSIIDNGQEGSQITLEHLISHLGDQSYVATIFIISLAFSFPISIPGLSTPFGLILALFGLWIVFQKEIKLTSRLKNKSISYSSFKKIGKKAISLFKFLEKFMQPRLLIFSENRFFICLNGLLIFILSLLLALPIPIPLTNLLAAFPIVLISLGLLEKDGIFILAGYMGSALSIALFILLFTTLSNISFG